MKHSADYPRVKHSADFGVGTFHIIKVDRCRIHLVEPLLHLVLEDPLLAGLLPSQDQHQYQH